MKLVQYGRQETVFARSTNHCVAIVVINALKMQRCILLSAEVQYSYS